MSHISPFSESEFFIKFKQKVDYILRLTKYQTTVFVNGLIGK